MVCKQRQSATGVTERASRPRKRRRWSDGPSHRPVEPAAVLQLPMPELPPSSTPVERWDDPSVRRGESEDTPRGVAEINFFID